VPDASIRLDAEQWTARADDHAVRVEAFVVPHIERAQAGESHPVWDFLFSYYSLRPRQLRCWHPVLEGVHAKNTKEVRSGVP
jgi:hypothetical protein